MPTHRDGVHVSPAVLKWARATSGLTSEQALRRLGVDAEELAKWESGKEPLSIPRLAGLAEAYHRPLAVFLLGAPPSEAPSLPDMRVLGGDSTQSALSERTVLAIRKARRVQSVARQIRPERPPTRIRALQLRTAQLPPEKAAGVVGGELGVDLSNFPKFPTAYRALSHWKSVLERLGVMVLQFPMPITDARGFTLSDAAWPVLVVNQTDVPRARCFTLFHELGHILRQKEGICNLGGDPPPGRGPAVETWCNAFAGNFLVPGSQLTSEARQWPNDENPPAEEIRRLANRYQVSETVILRRLLSLGRISTAQYASLATYRFVPATANKPSGRKEMRRNIPAERVAEYGAPFIEMVLAGVSAGEIGLGDVAEVLDIRLKHLPAISDRAAELARRT